jgi:hypothetical protein
MRAYLFDLFDPEPFSIPAREPHEYDFSAQPAISLLHEVSGLLMEVLGPMFWATLVLLFVQEEFFGT